ncbi:hypothetical protein K2173_027245 [Erythroxylum novogranatense]|uniref:Protein EXORDIUM-like 2 n=1 Tax=Erythroxylum novogranatense TaxID=1862640 RepID=A0AAV8U2D1_9ROSI|nr:hypothetical protein K2173_027245 [Erythroxylum novogranatense]
MAPIHHFTSLTSLLVLFILFHPGLARTRNLAALVEEHPLVLKYHNGLLLKGNVTINLLWYGEFSPNQRSIILDFLNSLSSSETLMEPSVSSWWKTTGRYMGGPVTVVVGNQVFDGEYSVGKSLTTDQLAILSSKAGPIKNTVNVVLTSHEVVIDGFCMTKCGTHSSVITESGNLAYAWVGNSVRQCPEQCAWPFHKPMQIPPSPPEPFKPTIYTPPFPRLVPRSLERTMHSPPIPQSVRWPFDRPIYSPKIAPLIPPNNDVGIDGMIMNLATVLAGTVTNPFNNGYFEGPANAPLEAVSACPAIFGKGSYPGYPGQVLVDKSRGASYNAHGINGRKFLLPAMWDPQASACTTLT